MAGIKPGSDERIGITHVVENLEIGGLEKVVLSLAQYLDAERYRSAIVCLGYGGELLSEVEKAGVSVHVLDKSQGFDPRLVWRMSRLFRRLGTDVVHCHNLGPLVYGALSSRPGGASGVVYTAHGMKTSAEKKPATFEKLGLIDDFVTVSDDAHRIAVQSAGVRPDRVFTVINGVDVELFDRIAKVDGDVIAQRRESIGLLADAKVFGIVARLSPAKDHATLFLAFASVAAEFRDARLVLVGDGEMRAGLEARAADLGLKEKILFLGSRHDVPELLSVFDCFVLSSYTEGLAVTLLEAMAAGLPVVATDVGGNAEVVKDGHTGVIVPSRDADSLSRAMRWVLEHGDEARGMGRRGRDRVSELFSIEAMVRNYRERYDRITGRQAT